MHPQRRDFIKCGALSVVGLAGERLLEAVPFAADLSMPPHPSGQYVGGDLSVSG